MYSDKKKRRLEYYQATGTKQLLYTCFPGGGGCTRFMHSRSLMTIYPEGARWVLTDQAGIACTKRKEL